jgi:hypothetical protein
MPSNPSQIDDVNKAAITLTTAISEALTSLFWIGANRGFATDAYPISNRYYNDFATPNPSEQAQRVVSSFTYNRDLEETVSGWLTKITGISLRFNVKPDRLVALHAGTDRPLYNILNEGFGSNQLTFALTQIAAAPNQSTICFEEPEIHLHPRAQTSLADLLVEVATAQQKQFIITTHSEHILYSLFSNLAEGKLDKQDLAIFYFSKEKGVAHYDELTIDESGRIEGGLRDFFEVGVAELKRFYNSLGQRQ